MLTLEEIKASVLREANGLKITRANYAEIADRVIAPANVTVYQARSANEEARVYREAQEMNTDDWLDIACSRVAINQMKQAIKLTRTPTPSPVSPKRDSGVVDTE